MTDIRQKINSLSAQKRALLVLRNPLSFSQQRLWFIEQLGAGGAAYNLYSVLRLEGRLDTHALQRSLDEIVRRHEALRTTFYSVDGQPIQIVHPSVETPLRVEDLSQSGEAERQALADSLLRARAGEKFDLEGGPLLRFTLLRLREDEHIFLLTIHHIVCDGWSMSLFLREMATLYEAFVTGRPPLPNEPAAQYGALVRWEQQWLQSESMRGQIAYWRERLEGMPSVLELPADRPRPKRQSFRGAVRTFTLPSAETEALRELSQRIGGTLFTTLLTVFKVLLYRLTGQDDIVVGSPVANRNRQEFEEVIGLFINVLVMRTQLSGDPTFVELLQRVKQTVQGAQAHQDLPFDRLVEELQPDRNLSHTPLVQVLFVQLVKPPQSVKLPGLTLKPQEVDVGTARFDLTLSMLETEDGLGGKLEYNSDLFDPATAERFVQQFQRLVAGVARDPQRRISELPLLSAAERQQLLVEWQNTGAGPDENLPFPTLFGRTAERRGDSVALVFEGEEFTYRELNRKVNQLARHLRGLGIGPGSLVALYLDRSAEMVISLLAVLKAGGAYVPLDPAYPRERLEFILEDSAAALIISQGRAAQEFPGGAFEVLDLGCEWEQISRLPGENLDLGYGPELPAYVIYTSGSTGKPKGVAIPHRALANFLQSMRREPGLTEQDSLLAITTLSFDIAALELLLPLAVGARVVIASRTDASDGRKLAEMLTAHGITTMQGTPATWQLLLDAGWQGEPSLKMLCGGDALTADLAAQLLSRGASLWNLYGPTETAIWSAAEEVTSARPPISIGRPIANTEIHILDGRMTPLPIGVPGEIYIGGLGLANGYAGRPGLTAEKFVPDPLSGRRGERLYRTGDLARRLPGGRIEFLGRIDYQVKLRGFRIELGEIESVLAAHPAVREAVAVVQEPSPGDKRLLAFVVPEQEEAPTPDALREFLRQKLPTYMVPSNYVVLEALPRTANGKIDRRALSSPEFISRGAHEDFVAPRTMLEEEVARIWAATLKTERVDIFANFFEAGGNSLLAMQVIHRIGQTFQLHIPLHIFFEAPSVAEMAGEIARRRAELTTNYLGAARDASITPDPESRHLPFPLTDVQQAYWVGRQGFFELGNVSSHSYIEFDFAELDIERLSLAVNRLVERHDMLRAVVLSDGTQQILESVPPYRVEVSDLGGATAEEEEARLLAIRGEMSHQVLPADRWPLFDIRASRMRGGGVRIHFGLDYLIADAWSVGIIFREIFEFYERPEAESRPLELSFRDWVLAEIAQQESESHQRAVRYWRERLPTLPPAPELPLATSPDALKSPRFVRRAGRLEPEVWASIKRLGARAGMTPSGILLGAFSEILTAWSKTPRFTINVTLFNRPPHHPQINDIVGDFTSLILLAIDGSRPLPLGLRARAVQEQLWKDLEHRSFSGVQVMRELTRMQGRPDASIVPVVFTSTLGQQNMHTGAFASGAEQGQPKQPGYGITQTPQVWLDHQVGERGDALAYNWDAVEDLFYPGVLDDMWDAYNHLLRSLAEEQTWQETGHPWLPEAQLERRREANATQAPLPHGLLHSPFVAQAKLGPDRPAVISPRRTLTYGQLDRLSSHYASRLRELGARPNELVAVVMEKGWEQAAAVLAVLKSGAAYLPINSSLPTERVHYLLGQGEVRWALTQPHVEASVDWPGGVGRLAVEWGEQLEGEEAEALEPVQGANDLAYVIFTSGSTGQPKGVMIDHRGALNTVLDVNSRFGVGPGDRVLGLSSLSFDLSVYDIFGTLAAGAALVLPEAEGTRDPAHWLELVRAERVTLWNSVPALMEMMEQYVSGRGAGTLDGLRVVMLSGDWIGLSLPQRIRGMCPGARVISMGGATEASIWSILYEVGEVDAAWASVPYGRPMANQSFHVLNELMGECPEWVPGQLYIGGAGLALGYWRDEEKTRASFVEGPGGGGRLYRTGDMGRWLPDGNIEFLGREDTQVKVQGHRIELGEVEAALEAHEWVRAAVAVAAGRDRTSRRLAAYVVLQDKVPDVEETLRRFLSEKLPEYMIPTSISAIESLPLSANGKVDRQALAQLESAPSASTPKAVARGPRTPVEEKIANVWAEILKVEHVGVDDNFFALGGDSLAAVRMVNGLRAAFGIEVNLRQLFETQTVSESAQLLQRLMQERVQEQNASLAGSPIEPDAENRFEPFPLNDIQYAYWLGRNQFFDLGNVAAHGYAEFELHNLDIGRLNAALQRLVERHDMLRAVVLPDGRQQILRTVPPYQVKVFDLRGKGRQEVTRQLEATRARMSHQMLKTSEWPLFEISVSVLDGRVRLHVSVDILVVDAWSSRILARELAAFYKDPELRLAPLELSFRDYVLAEIAFQDSELYRRSQKYWLERLPSIPPAPELPMVKALGEIKSPRFVRREGSLDAALWQQLKGRASQSQLTPSVLLLSAFAHVLHVWSKSPRFTINLTVFNRMPLHPQVGDIVGDFTTVILMAVDAGRAGTFESHARGLQEQLWEAMEHRNFSGVSVLRELARRQKKAPSVMTPVVFTSNLFEDNPSPGESAEGALQGEQVYGISQTPQVWLDHQARERNGRLEFNWDVIEELFPEGLFDDMFDTYCRLLESLAVSPEAWQAGGNCWLPPHQLERRREANATQAPAPEGLLHSPFVAQAKLGPDRPAVISPRRTLTYGQLDRLSSHYARRLRELGARPNELVAVVMEKGWEQAAAVLAVLKSGAAYLPINSSLPTERVHYLLGQGEVRWALTQPHVEASVDWPGGVGRLAVEWGEQLEGEEALEPVQEVGDLAYVIFTSGSTGQPKGVMIDHRGALNTVLDVNSRFGVGPGDRVLGLSSLSFDLSVYDIFGTLAAGAALVLPEAEGTRDPAHWLDLVSAEGVTIWNSVPALMEMMEQYVGGRGAGTLDGLRVVMLSGDWIGLSLPGRVRRMSPGARVISMGGATEASIWSILYEVGEVDAAWASVPYGRPMANQSFHVLNELMGECPEWVPGQLYIDGVGVAKGYWRDEEKTRASFVEGPGGGGRLYRTGDMGRWLPDGNIEFLGREDTQVKVQGHRIELGEVEAALEAHEWVRAAVAVAAGRDRTSRRLVAYVVLKDGALAAGQQADTPATAAQLTDVAVGTTQTDGLPSGNSNSPRGVTAPVENDNGRYELQRFDGKLCIQLPLNTTPATQSSAPANGLGTPRSAVSLRTIESLLSGLLQIQIDEIALPKYRYPSAGNLYPVQAYVFIKSGRVKGLGGGVYYYHPQNHSLVRVGDEAALTSECFAAADRAAVEQSDFALFLVARMDAIVPMYEQLSPDFCLLEAGYMGQLLVTTARENSVRLRPLQPLDFDRVREHFAVDECHVLVHALAGGALHGEPDAAELLRPEVAQSPDAGATPNAESDAAALPAWSRMAEIARGEKAAAGAAGSGSRLTTKLTDKIDRLEFKFKAAGLRQHESGRPVVRLDRPEIDRALIEDFMYRRSDREFLAQKVPFKGLNLLLDEVSRFQSERGGAAKSSRDLLPESYPLKIYLYVRPDGLEGVPGGTYFYDAQGRRLELLNADVELENTIHADVNRAIFDRSAFSLFVVGERPAAERNPDGRMRDLCLFEAGYMGQHLMSSTPPYGVGLCPIGWLDFDRVREHLNLKADSILLHTFLGGCIEPRQPRRSSASRRSHAASTAGDGASPAHDAGTPAHTPSPQAKGRAEQFTEELRSFLGKKLPTYMIPPTIVVLDELPLSSNGKVDRSALAALETEQPDTDAAIEAPRNPVELQFVEIWSDLVGLKQVSIRDNFFTIGGDSIKGIQFLARAKEAGLDINVRDFFEQPVIASLAKLARPVEAGPAGTAAAEAEGSVVSGGVTLSDFPDAEMSQQELEDLIAQFEQTDDANPA